MRIFSVLAPALLALALAGCAPETPTVPTPTFAAVAPAVIAPLPTTPTSAPVALPAAPTPTPEKTVTAEKKVPKKTAEKKAATKTTTKKTKSKQVCDLDAPVKIVGDLIVNRDCGYTDSKGRQRSHDPWIDGQYQDERDRKAAQRKAEKAFEPEAKAALKNCRETRHWTNAQCIADAKAGNAS